MKRSKERTMEDAKRLVPTYGPMAVFPWGPDGYTFCPLGIARMAHVHCVTPVYGEPTKLGDDGKPTKGDADVKPVE